MLRYLRTPRCKVYRPKDFLTPEIAPDAINFRKKDKFRTENIDLENYRYILQ